MKSITLAALRQRRAVEGHLPWFRRTEFLVAFFLGLILYAVVLLPDSGSPSITGWARIVAFLLLYFTWMGLILSDREKPEWAKNVAVLGLIFVLGWLFYRYSNAQWGKVSYNFLNLEKMDGVWPMLWTGLRITLRLAVVSAILSIIIGVLLGVLRSFHNPILEVFLAVYIDFFRAMPLIVLMLIVYYAFPFLGIELNAFASGVLSIALNYSASVAEIARSGIESIEHGQTEAAKALGLNTFQTMRYVILPQAVRTMIPPLTGSMVSLLKDTSVASVITLSELLRSAQQAVLWKANPTPVMLSSLIYLALLLPLSRFSSYLETRSKQWVRQAK